MSNSSKAIDGANTCSLKYLNLVAFKKFKIYYRNISDYLNQDEHNSVYDFTLSFYFRYDFNISKESNIPKSIFYVTFNDFKISLNTSNIIGQECVIEVKVHDYKITELNMNDLISNNKFNLWTHVKLVLSLDRSSVDSNTSSFINGALILANSGTQIISKPISFGLPNLFFPIIYIPSGFEVSLVTDTRPPSSLVVRDIILFNDIRPNVSFEN